MSINWYYYKDGRQEGPMSRAELEGLAAAGLISPDDQVISDQMQAWVRAADLEGLLAGGDKRQNALGGQFSPPPPPGAAIALAPLTSAGVQSPVSTGSVAPQSEAPVCLPGFSPPGPAQGTPAGANSASAPPPAFVAAAKTPPVFNQSAPGPVFGTNPFRTAAAPKRSFKLPLIIAGVLVCLIIFVVIIASLADPGPAAAPSSGGGQQTTPVSDPVPENNPPSGNTGQDDNSSAGVGNMLTFAGQGFGFTMNYPRDWTYEITEDRAVIFSGADEESDAYFIDVYVQPISGSNISLEDVYYYIEDFYLEYNGYSYGYDTSYEYVGDGQYNVLYSGGDFQIDGEPFNAFAFVIQRDSSNYYLIEYSAPEYMFEHYEDYVMGEIVSTFRFTN